MPLASRSQVAAALGLSDESQLSDGQVARIDGLLERVSAAVEREAQRPLGEGSTEVQVIVADSRVYLPQAVSVEQVHDRHGNSFQAELHGDWATVTWGGRHISSGSRLTVEYTRGHPSAAVSALVAGVVARLLTVEPGSPEAMAVDITAGADFRLRTADWVSSTALMTADEIAEARGFRSRVPNTIVHRV